MWVKLEYLHLLDDLLLERVPGYFGLADRSPDFQVCSYNSEAIIHFGRNLLILTCVIIGSV